MILLPFDPLKRTRPERAPIPQEPGMALLRPPTAPLPPPDRRGPPNWPFGTGTPPYPEDRMAFEDAGTATNAKAKQARRRRRVAAGQSKR